MNQALEFWHFEEEMAEVGGFQSSFAYLFIYLSDNAH